MHIFGLLHVFLLYNLKEECKRHLRKAEWDYVSTNIIDGLNNNNTKPFWEYVISKRQESGGIAPLRDRSFNLKGGGGGGGGGGGYGFLFRSEFFFGYHELEYIIFFPEINIRLYDKNSESDFFFSSTKIRIFFSATLGIRIFF